MTPPPQYDLVLQQFPGTTLLKTPQNGGPGTARNVGIEHVLTKADAEVVGFLDADDEMTAEWPQALDFLSIHKSVPIVSCGFVKNGRPRGTTEVTRLSAWRTRPFTRISSIFVRTSYLQLSGTRFLDARVGEDTEFIWRLVSAEGWQHLPVAVSSYNYDFKDHLIYPHPLYASCKNNPEFCDFVIDEGLFERVIQLNERNGLLLRRISPSEARNTARLSATFQYLAGAATRNFLKKASSFFSK